MECHIDAFALNIAYNDSTVATSVSRAFQAAQGSGLKLFFSFDYAGGGAWPKADVQSYLDSYTGNAAYYKTDNGQPFVSTFEGPDNAGDWKDLKAICNCFFMPDWSSKGAQDAWALGNADGLFSWAAWPWAAQDMNTYVDASYRQVLGNVSHGGYPYMMPVSPWFYTNLPGFDKNWLWRGDDLWYDRWQEVLFTQPEYVEIITWNDYGECHYIGPLDDTQYDLFDSNHGKAAYNYAEGFPHDGWRMTLPFIIDLYKTGKATISQEALTVWHRVNPVTSGCSSNKTSGNTASQLQIELPPSDVMQDKMFFSALLAQSAEPDVYVDGVRIGSSWNKEPYGGAGIYHGSATFSGHAGVVEVELFRDASILQVTSTAINDDCEQGIQNWNAYVANTTGSTFDPGEIVSITDYMCTNGTSIADFSDLCTWTCARGYCPISACLCFDLGPQPDLPKSTGVHGYPAAD